MILEKLWEKASVKFFCMEGMQVWSKGKIVGLVLPTLKACFTWTPSSQQQNWTNENKTKKPTLHAGSYSSKPFTAEIIYDISQARYKSFVSTHTKKEPRRNNCNCTVAGMRQSQAGRGQGTLPCLLEFCSSEEAALDRLSIELGCVHWGRRDWDWEVSFTDKPPVMSMLFTFMFGFSPAGGKRDP